MGRIICLALHRTRATRALPDGIGTGRMQRIPPQGTPVATLTEHLRPAANTPFVKAATRQRPREPHSCALSEHGTGPGDCLRAFFHIRSQNRSLEGPILGARFTARPSDGLLISRTREEAAFQVSARFPGTSIPQARVRRVVRGHIHT